VYLTESYLIATSATRLASHLPVVESGVLQPDLGSKRIDLPQRLCFSSGIHPLHILQACITAQCEKMAVEASKVASLNRSGAQKVRLLTSRRFRMPSIKLAT
jgi:hypothetical protein